MATDLARLVVSLEAQNTQLLTKLEQSERATTAWRKKTETAVAGVANRFKSAFAGVAIGAGVIAGFKAIVKASAESEASIKQLETALKSTSGTVGFTSNQLQGFAKDLMRASTFSDEAITDLETRLLSFSNVTGDVFKRATQATLDLSARMGKDLPAAALQIGKALNDPIKGLAGLSRAGVQFTAEQKAIIKALAETGHMAEAQGIILDRLQEKFGGAAAAARDTFAGSLKALGNAFGELLEAPNGPTAATDAINEFTRTLEDPNTVAAANKLSAGVVSAFAAIARGISLSINAVSGFGEALARAMHGAAIDDLDGLNDQLKRQNQYLSELQTGYQRYSSESSLGMSVQNKASDETIARQKAEIAATEKKIALTMELRRASMLAAHVAESPAGAEPVEKKSTAAANTLLLQSDKMMADLQTKQSAEQQAFREKIDSYKLAAMTQEARSVEQLRQQYADLDKAVRLGIATAEEAATVRAGLAAQAVESLRSESLTDEQRSVEVLQAKYIELSNLVDAQAISRKQADEIGSRFAQQWYDAESRKIDQFRIAAGALTEEGAALKALTDQFLELQRIVDADANLPEGVKRLTQPAADQIRAGMQERFDTEQQQARKDEFSNLSSGLLQQGEYDLSPLEQSLRAQEDMINESYDRRMESILASTRLSEEQQSDLMTRSAEARNAALAEIDTQRWQGQLQMWSGAFGELSGLMASHNAKLFNIGKAAAVAQATINIAQGITEALKLPWPVNIVAAAATAAAGGVQIANIMAAQPPSYDKGGDIKAGMVALVGEQGPEMVGGLESGAALRQAMSKDPVRLAPGDGGVITKPTLIEGPAHVTSRIDTARMMKEAGSQDHFSGLFDAGGYIPAGQIGMVGEQGREIAGGSLSHPFDVSRLSTHSESRPKVVLKNYNQFDTQLVDDRLSSTAGEQAFLNHASRNGRKLRQFVST